MRKKLMMMLLCATMAVTALAACGSKETGADSVESTSIESTEATTPEASVPSVEVDPEIENVKDEVLPENTVINMDFGTITRLGDNADYPNALEDVEIYFNGKTFQMSLPKDMCMDFEYDLENNSLHIFNEGKSRRAWIFFTEGTAPESSKGLVTLETMKNVTNYYGFTMLDDAELTNLVDGELETLQYVPVRTNDDMYTGTYLSYKKYTGEMEETKTSAGEIVNMYPGTSYTFFYGETNTNATDMATYIAESFLVLDLEDSFAENVVPELDENNQLPADVLEKYGLPGSVVFPANVVLSDWEGNLNGYVEQSTDEEMIAFVDSFANDVEWVYLEEGIETMNGADVVSKWKTKRTPLNFGYKYNGKEYTFNASQADGIYRFGIGKVQ